MYKSQFKDVSYVSLPLSLQCLQVVRDGGEVKCGANLSPKPSWFKTSAGKTKPSTNRSIVNWYYWSWRAIDSNRHQHALKQSRMKMPSTALSEGDCSSSKYCHFLQAWGSPSLLESDKKGVQSLRLEFSCKLCCAHIGSWLSWRSSSLFSKMLDTFKVSFWMVEIRSEELCIINILIT